MKKIKQQIKTEIRHLPHTLSKLVGGAMAVIGSTGVIVIVTRKPDPSYLDILPHFIFGTIGNFVFCWAFIFSKGFRTTQGCIQIRPGSADILIQMGKTLICHGTGYAFITEKFHTIRFQ
jgi:hypothetical protein